MVCLSLSSGCATILTQSYPAVKENVKGEAVQGDTVGYNYSLSEKAGDWLLVKQAICRENFKTTDVTRKKLHGVIPAVFEIPFFGFGLLDLVTAGVYARATVEEHPGEIVPGTRIYDCGDVQPAPDKTLFVQYPGSLTSREFRSGPDGAVNMNEIRPSDDRDRGWIVFVRDPDGLHYVRSFETRGW